MSADGLTHGIGRRVWRAIVVSGGSVGATLGCFLVLPLTQVIGKAVEADTVLRSIDTAELPPPPPAMPEPPPEKEPEPEDKPPELTEQAPPLDLSQLELALNPGEGGGLGGDFAVKLSSMASVAKEDSDALFSLSDLDQEPRIVHSVMPTMDAKMRAKAPATVKLLFVVDQQGRVESPLVQGTANPLFDGAALKAIKQWRFEPGKRKGQPVRFRMRIPITFPGKSS